jgi:hypothetical protein
MTSLEGSIHPSRRVLADTLQCKGFGSSRPGVRAGLGTKFGRKSGSRENCGDQWKPVLESAERQDHALPDRACRQLALVGAALPLKEKALAAATCAVLQRICKDDLGSILRACESIAGLLFGWALWRLIQTAETPQNLWSARCGSFARRKREPANRLIASGPHR